MIALEHKSEDTDSRIVIEDDGRVGYAYLLSREEVTSLVWLYNVGAAPVEPGWSSASAGDAPLNPLHYVVPEDFQPIAQATDVVVSWADGRAVISLHGEVHAVLEHGSRPGWCRLSAKPSPVARPLGELV